jgi:hypothetical protein
MLDVVFIIFINECTGLNLILFFSDVASQHWQRGSKSIFAPFYENNSYVSEH